MKLHKIDVPRCLVGEGPVWDVAEQALYLVDILGRKLHRHEPATGAVRSWEVEKPIGSMALRAGGGVIVALPDGVHTLDLETGETQPFACETGLDPRLQFNDGKVDRRGRFVVGTTDTKITDDLGQVYSVGADGSLSVIDRGIVISNGPCWSPDDRTFYFADSKSFVIYAYDYDIETGRVSNKREWVNTREFGGFPDGTTVDAEGRVWSALCEAGKVVAWDASGKVVQVIDFPVRLTSSVMFGGPQLDQLYVTSIDPSALPFLKMDAEPLAGETFVVEGLGVRGVPEPRFAG
jgi:sugar lactone lactonase YvrE